MMFKFRRMYPLGSIASGYIAPWHPWPAAVLLVLAIGTLVGMYYGYWVNMVSGFFFYLIAFLWFVLHRYRKVYSEKPLQADERAANVIPDYHFRICDIPLFLPRHFFYRQNIGRDSRMDTVHGGGLQDFQEFSRIKQNIQENGFRVLIKNAHRY